MREGTLILTFDIGTTGNKCTLFSDSGKELYAETVPYRTIYPKAGWAEQNPDDMWKSVVTGTRKLLEKSRINPGAVGVVGLSGHMNGCIPVNKEGKALFHNIIHSDCRTMSECREIAQVIDPMEFYSITGNRLDPHYSLPKLLWLRKHHPHIYRETSFFLNIKDYISYKLTGNLGITDYSDASLMCMLDMKKRDWAENLIKALGLDMQKLPRLQRSSDIAGYITPEASALLGLLPGTPVVTGGGDGACATKGAGIMEAGKAYNYLGSSSWIGALHKGPVLDSKARLFNYYDLDGENCDAVGTVQSAAISYDWAVENIGKYELEKNRNTEGNAFEEIENLARKSPIGAEGVFFVPYLMGERTPHWDEKARGAFIGFTLFHNRNHLFRAVYEGVAYALKNVLDVLEENGMHTDALTLIGGGAKSRLWNEIMCNVYGKRIMVHKYPAEATSLGAAMAAGVGVGIFKDFQAAGGSIEYNREYVPDEQQMEEYRKYYRIYNKIYSQLKPIYDEMAML